MVANIFLNYIVIFCDYSFAFCFGGNITVFPIIVGDFFDLQNQTKIYGIIYHGFEAPSGSFIAALAGNFIGTLCLVSKSNFKYML